MIRSTLSPTLGLRYELSLTLSQRADKAQACRAVWPKSRFCAIFHLKYVDKRALTMSHTAKTETPAARANAWLNGAGLRPTRQRKALAELLIGDGRNRHVTAERLFEAAKGVGAPVSLATVYNTLKCFTEAGLLTEIAVDGARSYFDTRTEEHPHFYWEDENRLTDAPADAIEFARIPDAPEGMEISKIDIVIRLQKR
jgi:Fur family iron response transcriptional regulator